jgi:hypothetical protein
MLMGCAAGNTAQVKIEATVEPSGVSGMTYIGVRQQGTTTILNSELINSGGQTMLSWPNTAGDAVFEIVGGADINGNSELDASEVCEVYEDGVRAINESSYDGSVLYLQISVLGGEINGLPVASDLLSWFLNNTGNDSSVSLSDGRLTHPVGVQWSGTSGSCSKYNFSNCPRVVWSTEFGDRLIAQAAADHYAEIDAYFTAHPGDTHVFGPWSCTLPNFEFPSTPIYGNAYDADMFRAFHAVGTVTVTSYSLTIEDDSGDYQVTGRAATGYFHDLYDFQYSGGAYSYGTHAARVQSGYPSLGAAGRVFQVDRCNFDGSSGM